MNNVIWFNGRSTVGIVQVNTEYDGIHYYIGSPPYNEYSPNAEADDIQWIADWGARFPRELGEALFNGDPLRNGSAVQIPMNREQAEAMIRVGTMYLDIKND